MESLLLVEVAVAVGGKDGEDLGGAGRPLSEGSPYPPNLPHLPELPCTATAGLGAKTFLAFWTAVAVQGSFWRIGRCGGDKRVRLRTRFVGGARRECMACVSEDLSPLISRLRDSFPPRGSLLYAVRTWHIGL